MLAVEQAANFRARGLRELSVMATVERPRPENELSLPRILMAAVAVLLLVYGLAFLVVIDCVYRHLIAAPTAWLLSRLAGLAWRS